MGWSSFFAPPFWSSTSNTHDYYSQHRCMLPENHSHAFQHTYIYIYVLIRTNTHTLRTFSADLLKVFMCLRYNYGYEWLYDAELMFFLQLFGLAIVQLQWDHEMHFLYIKKNINNRLKCTFSLLSFKKLQFWSPIYKNYNFIPLRFWPPMHLWSF